MRGVSLQRALQAKMQPASFRMEEARKDFVRREAATKAVRYQSAAGGN